MKNTVLIVPAIFITAVSALRAELSSRDDELVRLRRENRDLKQALADARAQNRVTGKRTVPTEVSRKTERETSRELAIEPTVRGKSVSVAREEMAMARPDKVPDYLTPPPLTTARGFPLPSSYPVTLREVRQTPSALRTAFETVYLRKAVFSENGLGGISDPAEITYVHPGKGNDSYAIDAGLASTFITSLRDVWRIDWGVGAEYHRNSDVLARKDLFQTGLVYKGTIGGDPKAEGDQKRFVRLEGSSIFKNDNVKDFHAFASNVDVFPVFGPLYIDELVFKRGPIPFRWQPYAGFSYEKTTTTAAGVAEGGRLLIRYGAEVEIYPLYFWLKESVELTAGFTARSIPSASGLYESDNDWNGYFQTSLTYWFRENSPPKCPEEEIKRLFNFGIGVTYERGDNPEQGEEDVDLLTLSFQAKY